MNVFILGLDHSRSTIVDLYLGEKFNFVSLGEVRRTLFPVRDEADNLLDCSCGKIFQDCSVWSYIQKREYRSILKDPNISLIDSSKDLLHYRKFKLDVDCVVFTYRSFKNWYPSVIKSLKREERHGLRKVKSIRSSSDLRLYLRNFRFLAYTEFVVTHIRISNALRGQQKTFITSSKDLEAVQFVDNLKGEWSGNHIVRGNRVSRSLEIELKEYDESDYFSKILKALWG